MQLFQKLTGVIVISMLWPAAAGLAENSDPAGATPRDGGKILIMAAASLKTALDQVAHDWTARTGQRVTISYSASSAAARQIEAGAPADIFASADLDWMDYLEQKHLIESATRANVVANTLVLIAGRDEPTDLKIAPGFDLAAALGSSRLATGDPASVPAGRYARAALTSLGVWDTVADKIAAADNVRSALQFVARGEAKFGIVYGSDAIAEPGVKVIGTFPASSHAPIVYPFAAVASANNAAARQFLAHLKTPEAEKIFIAQGFQKLP